jgi:hypothetical protein
MQINSIKTLEILQKKREFSFLTSLTHLWAVKAHEYWAEASDLFSGHLT